MREWREKGGYVVRRNEGKERKEVGRKEKRKYVWISVGWKKKQKAQTVHGLDLYLKK